MPNKEEPGTIPYGLELAGDEDGDINPRDSNILRAILEEGLTVFSFDGVKRLLGVHQEQLSRVLDRLEDEGLVERVEEGYKVTLKGGELGYPLPLNASPARIPIVQSLLPHDIQISHIVSRLKGRWFGSLRWLGYQETDEGTVLKWITQEEGIQVDARFTETFLSIEARVGEGREVSLAVKASHQLLGYISRIYTTPQRARGLATPVAFYPGDSYPDLAFA